MRTSVRQEDERRRLLEALEPQNVRIRTVRDTLSPEQVGWAPPGGGWSVGQVFEHLTRAADSYLDLIRPLVEAAPQTGRQAVMGPWRPTVMGGFLTRALQRPGKLPAPRRYRPGPRPRTGVIDAFLDRQQETAELLGKSAGMVWQTCRFVSPITSLIRPNLGDGFNILVVHTTRHLDQVDRIGGHAMFPR